MKAVGTTELRPRDAADRSQTASGVGHALVPFLPWFSIVIREQVSLIWLKLLTQTPPGT